MEENILSLSLVGKELNIIHYKHINDLIKIDEIIYGIVLQGINKLISKLL